MVCDFAHVGFTAATPLPNQGFPARFLGYNDLASLPDGIFDNLSSLEQLALYDNDLASLSDSVFDNLFNLEELYLAYNELTLLPNGVFDAVSNLKRLSLYSNELNSLPDGVFTGLSSLEFLEFDGNPGAPFLLEAELEQQGGDAVVVKIAEAAPFDLEVAPHRTRGRADYHGRHRCHRGS